ncbi:MAG: ATP-binding protein [Deltaproteobacteria bacterium]|nr:ATP-binding protein [Deltaproteobacteria bacterium]
MQEGLLTVSIRVKLATLASAIVVLVVLGQTMQSLVVSSMAVQEELSLRARLVLMSVAGAIAQKWEPGEEGLLDADTLPELEPYAERVARVLEVHSFAVLDEHGSLVGFAGEEPTPERIAQASHLRLRATPSSIWAVASRPLELVARAPIIHGDEIVGYVFCTFTSDEPRERLRTLVTTALYSALFWVALGGGLTLWLARRFSQPLVDLATALYEGDEVYSLPPEGPAHGELGVVQRRLVDFTERIQAERARAEDLNQKLRHQVEVVSADLAHSAEQREAILDSIEDAILVCDREARILAANRVAREWLTVPCPEDKAPEDRDECLVLGEHLSAAVLRVVRTGHGETFPLPEAEDPSGGPGRRSLRARIHQAAEGAADADAPVIVILEDLSTWRALEAQVLQSERLASLGTLSAGMAHQIGNHLNAIRGHAELAAQRAGETDERISTLVAGIRDEVRAASDLMQRALQLARTEPVPTVELQIPVLVREALALAEVHARHRGVAIDTSGLADPGCRVWGDPQLLTQVLLNLFVNAIQAMGKGGHLEVSSCCCADETCSITVDDDGPGIEPEAARRIFEPFYTTKPMGEGTGLGLPIARRILELHGGELRFEPRPGKGARFVLVLPVARKDAPRDLQADEEGKRELLGGIFGGPGTRRDGGKGETS